MVCKLANRILKIGYVNYVKLKAETATIFAARRGSTGTSTSNHAAAMVFLPVVDVTDSRLSCRPRALLEGQTSIRR